MTLLWVESGTATGAVLRPEGVGPEIEIIIIFLLFKLVGLLELTGQGIAR